MGRFDDRSDEELVARVRGSVAGDRRAFDVLVRRHQERVKANCRYLTRRPSEAEDLAQDVFVKAYFALKRFEGRSTFKTWIHRIKINHCLNYLAKQKVRRHVDLDVGGDAPPDPLRAGPDADRGLERQDARRLIGEVLETLPDTLRVPLVMRDLDQLSYQEIADELGVGLSAVKMRIKRGREQFRAEYAQRAAH
ncbi:MAG: sigma-70 family RNA polymerase sigma factor [Myxococcales bacterium]|nr:sigma-70 family RNA polymerase sigma factor [Myxococcales bacterium]MCB9535422.1 sigma-70 family RNA polymerase sigma factor [Myxococcales bacterium]